MLPTKTLLTTEDTENTEENQWHGGIRGANGAGQKQKLCKQACQIFAFFRPIPAYWDQSVPICDEIRQKHLKNWMYWRRLF